MAKLVTSDVTNFQNEQTAAGTINSNSAATKLAMENTLSRDGTSPNQMLAQLDMNSFRIINLPAPQASGDPLRQGDVSLSGVIGYTAGTGITISGLVISSSASLSGDDSLFTIFNHSDISKIAKFSCASITTATTRTFTFPDATTTLVGDNTTQTLTNKTLTSPTLTTPTMSSPTMTGTPVAPTAAARTSTTQVATTAFVTTQTRELLTAGRTYFVRTDGSNSNTGLTNTSGGAFLTLQKAYDTITNTLDLGGQAVTIQVADGTYAAGIQLNSSWVGGGSVTVSGNASTPDNVLISASDYCFLNNIPLPGLLIIQHMKLTTSANECIRNTGPGILVFSDITFGASAGNHLTALGIGAAIQAGASYRINGNATGSHAYAQSQAQVFIRGITITIGARLVLVSGFAVAQSMGLIAANATTITGSQTCTMTIASPAVVSATAHGLTTGDGVVFHTSSALPTGVTAGTRYFIIATGLTANAFEFSTTSGGAAVNTSGSQSGTHNFYGGTGPSHLADGLSYITTNGGGLAFFPGNTNGTTTNGGVFQ